MGLIFGGLKIRSSNLKCSFFVRIFSTHLLVLPLTPPVPKFRENNNRDF